MAAPTPLIPFDDRDGYIWLDGKILPWRDAKLHVLSHGLHYGGSVFEGERSYGGNIFKLREHSERFIRSGDLIDMKIQMSVKEIENASREVLEANKIMDGYIRPIAWRGTEQLAISGQQCKVHVAFACWPWPKYFFPKGGEGKGIALKTSKWVRPDPRSMPVQSKAAGIYMVGTMAKHAAERDGYDDVLMHDYKGRVAESSGSNLFIVKNGAMKTPVPECFLNGITRQTIMQMAKDMKIPLEEGTIMPEDLKSVDEIFVTGTAAEVTPVGKIDDREYETGPVTKRLMEAYSDLVRGKGSSTAAA